MGIADAYAAAMEYLDGETEVSAKKACLMFERYHAHPTHGLSAGSYTDDTEMSVANARVLIEHGTHRLSPRVFADAWLAEFRRGKTPERHGPRFRSLLAGSDSGMALIRAVDNSSARNGAAMRAVPFGVIPDKEALFRVATLQAAITHHTHPGMFAARAVALMSHFALYESASFSALPAYCLRHLPEEDVRAYGNVFQNRWHNGRVVGTPEVPVSIATVHAVADVLAHHRSFRSIMRRVMLWGGDTDSVAAIAWGIASARYRKERLPDFLERDLEGGNGETGARYLRRIGIELMAKFSG
jgi:ADP-ribosylglycohydrolase